MKGAGEILARQRDRGRDGTAVAAARFPFDAAPADGPPPPHRLTKPDRENRLPEATPPLPRPPAPARVCRRLAALALAAGLLTVAGPAGAASPPAVGVVVAKKQPVFRTYSYTGRVVGPRVVKLQARVSGYLERRLFRQGSEIKKGELLYVIERGPYRAARDRAQADVAKAQAAYANAKLAFARAKKLLHTPAGQQSAFDNARATKDGDAAALAAAKAQLETAKINYGYTEIRAPISGRIGATEVNVGNVVGPNSGTLATIVSENPMKVVFAMPVVDARKLRRELADKGGLGALSLRLRLPDGDMDKQTGTIDFASNRISEQTDTLQLEGSIANPVLAHAGSARVGNRQLTSGEFVTVILRTKSPSPAIVLPRKAVLADALGNYVLVVNGQDKVERRNVTLAASTPSRATVASGLSPGARVIVDGIEKVHPGVTVKPGRAAGAPKPG